MALELTTQAFLASRETGLEPQLIVQVDGVDLIFGIAPVTTAIKYDDEGLTYDEDGLTYDGVTVSPRLS
jgi:hypothetical protein